MTLQRLGMGPPLVAGVCVPFPAGVAGAGVGAREGAAEVTALLLCAICALTR
jgi:hypothetical protein